MAFNDTAVEAQGLTKIYGSGNTEVIAMRDVTFSVQRSEVVALLGPSGAGKSTLLTAPWTFSTPSMKWRMA
jgi:putative ABC transport system ATP-binding protein